MRAMSFWAEYKSDTRDVVFYVGCGSPRFVLACGKNLRRKLKTALRITARKNICGDISISGLAEAEHTRSSLHETVCLQLVFQITPACKTGWMALAAWPGKKERIWQQITRSWYPLRR
jgi:hypothetical protein